MLESNDLIRDINCNDSNYATLNVDNLKTYHNNYKLVVYKNFNTSYWNKNSSLCPYWEISPLGKWRVRSVDYRKESDVNWERMRLHNEWVASSIGINIKKNKDKNYLLIYESNEPSFFWDFLKNHHGLEVNRKVFSLDNGLEKRDFCVLSNIKRFKNFNKTWNSIIDFEKAVLNQIESEEV